MANAPLTPLESVLSESQGLGLPEFQFEDSERRPAPRSTGTPGDLLPVFEASAQKYGVPVNVLLALGDQESRFNPRALGQQTKWGRAKGLMQYLDSTAANLGINPYDPQQSIEAAAKQLRERLDKGYSMEDAVKEHFAGPDRKLWGSKTAQYGKEVMEKAARWGENYQPTGQAAPAATDAGARPATVAPSPLTIENQKAYERQLVQSMLDDLNRDEPGRYSAPTAEQLAQAAGDGMPLMPGPDPQQVQKGQQQAQQGQDGFLSATGKSLANIPYNFKNAAGGLIQMIGEGVDDQTLFSRAQEMGILKKMEDDGEIVMKDGGGLSGRKLPFLKDGQFAGVSEVAAYIRANADRLITPEQQVRINGLKPNAVTETGKSISKSAKDAMFQVNPNGPLAKYGSMIIGSTAEMAPALLAGMVTRNPNVTLSMIGGQVYGQSYDRARDPGQGKVALNPSQASAYAMSQALAEAIPSALPVGVILKEGKNLFTGLVSAGAAEALQEGITGALQAGIDKGTIDPNMTWEEARQQIVDSMIVGAGAGVAMKGGVEGGRKAAYELRGGAEGELGRELNRAVDSTELPGSAEQQARAAFDPNNVQSAPVTPAPPVTPENTGPLGRAMARATPPEPVPEEPIAQPAPAAEPIAEPASPAAEAQPAADEFMGAPGTTINVAPQGVEPFAATVESYAGGEVILRDQEGNRFQVSREDLMAPEAQQADTQQTAVPEPAAEVAAPAADPSVPAPELNIPRPTREEKKEPKAYDQMDEAELRDRLKYLAGQAKATGWNKSLMQERRKVEKAIEALAKPAEQQAAPVVETPAVEPAAAQPATPAPSATEAQAATEQPAATQEPVKWFGSQEKAQAFIDKKKLGDTHEIVQADRRFEIRPKAATEEAPAVDQSATSAKNAPVQSAEPEKVTGHVNRARKLIGADVGDTIVPSADIGYSKGGDSYVVESIQKNGVVYVRNTATGARTNWGRADLERAKRAGVTFERQQAQQPVAERTAPGQQAEWSAFPADSGTLNVPRAEMPQIKAEHRGAMVNFLNARGIAHEEQTVPADSLKPTQAEFSPERVAKAREFTGGDRSILVSSDGHVLDGHHQWLAKRDQGEDVKVIRLDAPIRDLLPVVAEFPSSTLDQANSAAPTVSETATNDNTPQQEVQQEPAQAKPAAPQVSENKIFTEDAAERARALLRSKLSQLNSGIDPEIMQAGITLAGYHIEKGARTFAAYAKAMIGDLGEVVRPYLKSWYLGVRFDPRAASFDGMNSAAEVEGFDLAQLEETRNEPQPLDQPGQGALEGAPARAVQGAEGQEPAGERPARGGRADARGNERAGSQRADDQRGLGDGEGAVPVPAGRERAGRAAGERGAVQRGDGGDSAGRGGPAGRDPGSVTPSNGVASQQRPANYTITEADQIGQGGAKTKYKANVEAIRLLKQLEQEGRAATADEQAILAKYVGWGGLPQAFERSDKSASQGWGKEVAELKELLTPEEYSAAASSTKNAHYTSPEIVAAMWRAMDRLGFKGGRVLEPSVGVGNFLGLMPHELRKASALHGVELDRITSGIAAQLYPRAKIARMGFQDYVIPDGHFDIAIGNPPFGRESLYDGKRKDLSGFSIHNYFFAKSLDGLRPGGVLAMVVTNRMLDVPGDKARRYMADRADFLGAIRLPNDAFMANAGTAVTTDIIFMRKRAEGEKPAGAAWMEVRDYTDKDGNTVPLNEYFHQHPEMMLGDFGAYGSMYREGEPALVARAGQDTAAELERAIASLPEGVMAPAAVVKPETSATVRAENIRVGSMFVDGDAVKVRREDVLGENVAEEVSFPSDKARDRVVGMIGMRDQLSRLRSLQLDPSATERQIEAARKELNRLYDGFVKENGPVNLDANKRLFRDDPTWPQLSALEDGFDKGISSAVAKKTGEEPRKPSAKKAAIFSKRTQSPYQAPSSASSAKDALVSSLAETGRVDLDLMARLYGKPKGAILMELGDLVFQDPVKGYVTRDEYLSGNVKAKLAQARKAAETDPAFAPNVQALEAVQPADIEAVDINVKPGAPWVPAAVMADFANHIGEGSKARAIYNPASAKWAILNLDASRAADQRFATGRVELKTIIEAAANQKALQVFDRHPDGTSTLNETETQLANDKVNAVKEEWGRWIWSDDARRQQLGRLYNDTFNTNVAREFDGSHLTFPGKVGDDIITLRPHQGNAVWRIIQSDTTLTDHVVGAGKTFTLIAAAMELRRMGLAKKPMFVVPNHLVGQWAADFVKLYPGANVLAATKKDFEKENRKRLFARIATGDWDAVIVAHSSFGKVEVEPKEQAAFIEEQIADLDSSIELMRQAEGKESRNVKQTQKRRDALREKLKKLFDAENKDDNLYWGELGVDALFLDEAHEFKNLAFSTSMNRVAGLGNQTGSQKAADMFLKVQQVLKATGGRNVVFATGTPISNTMAEMYTMQRYLDYPTLKGQGISHFDAWARMFGEVVTDWELSPSGKYKMNSRFAKFVNMPELMQRYTSFADVINRDDINRMLAAQGKKLPVPKVKGGKPENVVVQRSPAQASYIGEPIKDAEGNDTDEYPRGTLVWRSENLPKKAEKGADNMLKIMGDARKAALDMRLIDPGFPDFPGSKVNEAADRIVAIHERWAADRGTQLVFIDLSTPKNAKAAEAARLRDLVQRAEDGDESAIAELDKVSPDELMALDGEFSVYDDLKQKLIERGIPEAEIAFIHDASTELQKDELFGKVRSGRVRVLFGSTAKMGAGMNVQDRLVALHHLDAPWRPSDLEQREGRIIRQGNRLYERDPEGFEVEILRYATKQTLDSRMWQTIEGKANFIEQVRKGASSSREIEDVAGEAANAAEMKAASSGNPLILEEMSLRQKVRKLENERMGHDREQFRLRDSVRSLKRQMERSDQLLDELRQDAKRAKPEDFELTVDGQVFDKRKEAGQAIIAQAAEMESRRIEEAEVGKYGDFTLRLERVSEGQFVATLEGAGSYQADFELDSDPIGLSMRITNAVKDLAGAIEQVEARRARTEAEVPKLEAQITGWPKAQELAAARERHAQVLDQLKPKKKETPAAQGETKASVAEELDRALSMTEDEYIAAVNPAGKRLDPEDRMRLSYGDLDTPAGSKPVETFKDKQGRDVIVLQDAEGNMYAQVDGKTAGMMGPQEDGETVIDLVEEAKGAGIGTGLVKAYIRQNPMAQSGGFSPAGEATRRAAFRQLRAERQSSMGPSGAMSRADLERTLRDGPLGSVLGKMLDRGDLVLHDIAPSDVHPATQGWTDRQGKMHLVANQLTDQNAQAVLLHEAFHSGAEPLLKSERWKNLLARLNGYYKATEEGRLQGEWADAFRRVKNAQEAGDSMSRLRAIEELGAYAIENYEKAPAGIRKWVDGVLGAIKDFLYRRFGIQAGDVTPAQLRALAVSALRGARLDARVNEQVRRSMAGDAPSDAELDSWFTRKLTDAMAGPKSKGQWSILATAPMDRMIEELAGNNPNAQEYLKLKRDMDAYRAKKHTEFDTTAQQWLKLNVRDRKSAKEMAALMHEATIAQVDPAEPFKSIMTKLDNQLMSGNPNSEAAEEAFAKKARDEKRREAHKVLRARFLAMPEAYQQHYRQVRDTYKAMTEELDQILMDNLAAAIDMHGRKAEREYEKAIAEIRDDGLTGQEKADAEAAALLKYNTAMTKLKWNKKARMTQLRQQFEANRLEGPYFPLARFGDYFVTVRDRDSGEVLSFSRFETRKEQQMFANQAKRLGNVQTGLLSNDAEMRGAVDPRFVTDVEDILAGAEVPDAVKDQVWQRYLESMPDMSMRKGFIHRKNRAGYTDDALRAFASRMFHGAHQLGRLKFGARMQESIDLAKEAAGKSKTPERDMAVVNEINRRHDYVMNPKGGALAQRLTSAAFIYHLSLSPAAALVNLSQTVMIGIPVIGAKYGMVQTNAEMAKALGHFITGKGRAERSKSLTEDERKAMRDAYDAGIIESTQSHNLAGVGETGIEYSAVRNKVMGVLSWQFHQAERLNREVTFLAAYRLAKKSGMDHQRAVDEAARLTYKTHFDYANTNRPRAMHGDVAKVALVFRNYQINMLWRLFRDTHQVLHGDKAARREALYQLGGITGMMALNAGVRGVWLYGIAMVIASMFFGDDAEEKFKKGTVDLLGPSAAGLLLNGIPGHLTGTALSERIGMPDLWFRSPDRQLEGQDEFNYWQSQLMGALPGIAQNMWRGWGQLRDGNEYRGIETMAPKFIKDLMRAARYANEGATTLRGDSLVQDIHGTELLAQMLGFTPAVIAEQYERNNALKNAEKRIMDARRSLLDRYAAAFKLKDQDEMVSIRGEIMDFNKENREVAIKPDTIRQSIRGRQRYSERGEGGVTLNPKLDRSLRDTLGQPIYR